jgi:tetratricopeptide (TPR) repeat protein
VAFPEAAELSAAEENARLVEACRKILIRDATAPARWCDLAEAFEQGGEIERAEYCFGRALAYGPNQPPIWLRAAEYDLRRGQAERAAAKLARILTLVEEYDPVVFEMFDAMPLRAGALLGRGVPAMPRPARAWLRHQIGTANAAGAEATWSWIRKHGFADDALAGEYADFLIRQGRHEQAARDWAEYLGARRGDYRRSNFIFNGSFEWPPTGAPFDWRIAQVPGAEAGIEAGGGYAGFNALRIRFLGRDNLEFRHVSQKTALGAGRWRLEAWVRSEELTTNEGVRLCVAGLAGPEAVSEAVTGSSPWRKLGVEFTVPSGGRLAEIQIFRRASLKLDNKIRGTVWIDAVRLEPLG